MEQDKKNEVEVVGEGRLAAISADAAVMAERLSKVVIAPGGFKPCEDLRGEANAMVKGVEKEVADARKKYLAPFEEAAAKVTEAIAPLKAAAKDFSARLLEAKKIAFKEEMEQEYMRYADVSGELPASFEEIYEPSWYSETKTKAKVEMAAKVRKARIAKKRVRAYITVECTEEQLADLQDYMAANLITNKIIKEEN